MRRRPSLLLVACLWAGCGGESASGLGSPTAEPIQATNGDAKAKTACPGEPVFESRAPGVEPEQLRAEYWLDDLSKRQMDQRLLDARAIRELNAALVTVPGAFRDITSDDVAVSEHVEKQLQDRLEWIAGKIGAGDYIEPERGSFAGARAVVEGSNPVDEFRVIADETPLFCVPLASGLFKEPVDRAFDRNRCASLHRGEQVRVLKREAGDDAASPWSYVHAGHSVGWIRNPAWTPPIAMRDLKKFRDTQPRLMIVGDDAPSGDGALRFGTDYPLAARAAPGEPYSVLVPTPQGLETRALRPHPDLRSGVLPFTRRNVFDVALRALDDPYGWGGHEGGRDCSRFLHDVFTSFGIHLARHSGVQARLGSRTISVEGLDEPAKRAAMRDAAADGIVLLYMPGHIMLYLGHRGDRDFVVSSLSEYLVPCPGGEDTVHRLDRVTVTDLELGRGSERTSFVERITTIAVFGGPREPRPGASASG